MPSYFDFVRLRSLLKAEGASFVPNCEYTPPSDVGRGRAAFFDGRARVMLYSERAHYYRRHTLRGIKRITFYGPPENPGFYSELVNLVEADGPSADVCCLFTRWDAPALERIVGTERCRKMLASDRPAFVFC